VALCGVCVELAVLALTVDPFLLFSRLAGWLIGWLVGWMVGWQGLNLLDASVP